MRDDLRLTFLGHQTWHISDGTSTVLLDPILERAFGASPSLPFTIWPPRAVDVEKMPKPDAVILSHEHLDHFHLPSLNRLDRDAPVYMGVTVPQECADAIAALGFKVVRVDYTTPISAGDLEIYLYPAAARTGFWESRVAQPLIRHVGCGDVFIGVDADVSDLYLEQLRDGTLDPPRMAIVSNNAQTVPYGANGADANLLPGLDGPRHRTTGIEILHGLLIDYLRPLGEVFDVALCGNGFTTPTSPHGPFMYADHRELAGAAVHLQHLFSVHGPRPGDQLVIPADGGSVTTRSVTWVTPDIDAENRGRARLAAFLATPRNESPAPITPPLAADEVEAARELIDDELPRLAHDLIATRTGALAIGLHDYLDGPLSGERLALRLLGPPDEDPAETLLWDITGPAFVRTQSLSRDATMSEVPFGIEIFWRDFAALFMGRVQIWDIIGGSYQGWHVGEPMDSPVYALYAIYGEHQRPDPRGPGVPERPRCPGRTRRRTGVSGDGHGPLDGATVQRPADWLPRPLTTDRCTAETQALELLALHHPAYVGRHLRCLTARYRGHVIELGDETGPCAVFKRHADEVGYLAEVIAYGLLQGETILPELLDASDTARTMIVEYVESADVTAPGTFEELIVGVTVVHTAPVRWPAHIAQAMARWRLERALTEPTPAWVHCGDAWRLIQNLHAEAYGCAHVPLGHLDLKPEHVRRHSDGTLAIIDGETLRPDLTGIPDLVTLAWLACHIGHPRPQWVRHAYRAHVNEAGADWSDAALIRALRTWARATGLRTLHDADR